MTSSIPAVVDRLLTFAGQATANVAGAVVADGWSDSESPTMFGVGADQPPFFVDAESSPIEGGAPWDNLGASQAVEEFTVPCYIYVGTGGADMATVRQAAFTLWDSFFAAFKADIKLGVLSRWATVERFTVLGPRTADEAEGGRYCLIQFYVACKNII